jgi:hypothetical protein
MADQSTELRRINWSECFPFTHLFKTFRMATSPSKLALALAAVILTGLAGGILDGIWSSKCLPVEGEINGYWQGLDVRAEQVDKFRSLYEEIDGVSADSVLTPIVPEKLRRGIAAAAAKAAADKAAADKPANEKVAKAVERFQADRAAAVDEALKMLKDRYAEETEKLGRSREDRKQIAETAREKTRIYHDLKSLRPQGIFHAFLSYETACVRQMLDAARVLNFTGQLDEVIASRSGGLREASYASVKTGPHGFGALPAILLMLRGVQWLLSQHFLYAVLFLLVSLAIWSLFGGAICRVAALNFARDERISVKAALAFASRKFLGFLTAPLLPVLAVAGIGVCLIVAGLVLAIPWGIGGLLGGLFTGLSLLGGFILTLVILGAIGGFGLMWPTIAVEGSDGFDAISRSYSYLFSRPWRAAFYAVVTLVYGSLCYLFARFLVLVVLKSTRYFVGLGGCWTHRPGVGDVGAGKVDAIWAAPSFEKLFSAVPPFGAASWGDHVGAFLIGIWVMLAVGLLCAFLASFFLSGSTVIYYLLRKEVDATDLAEVFVEEEPELKPDAATGTPASSVPAAAPSAPPASPSA